MAKSAQLIALVALAVAGSSAQVNRDTLTGYIIDPSGAVVPGVKATAVHVETGSSVTTLASESGSYPFRPCKPVRIASVSRLEAAHAVEPQ